LALRGVALRLRTGRGPGHPARRFTPAGGIHVIGTLQRELSLRGWSEYRNIELFLSSGRVTKIWKHSSFAIVVFLAAVRLRGRNNAFAAQSLVTTLR
jgi:hypothetical protein